jgi:hypothetical protein
MTEPTVPTKWTPKFGERVVNVYASPENPRKVGLFVRSGRTPHGRMNAGPWWELTDGHGDFWRTSPENCVPYSEAAASSVRRPSDNGTLGPVSDEAVR